jgi:diguanylate cyclase (GGDEF)-like protein
VTWFRHQALALFILLVSLAVTGWMWQHERAEGEHALRARADFNLREISSRIEQQMAAYQQMLRGVQGLYVASDRVERAEFQAYVDSLQLGADFSGIDGVGVVPLVADAHKEAHLVSMRRQGFADYAIQPSGRRVQYAPLTQLEPLAERNRLLVGHDMLADPRLQGAMEKARDSGAPAITAKLSLALEEASSGNAYGFLMFLPLYDRGLPHATLAQRRRAISGWVVAPFRISDLMASLYGERAQRIGFRVYDGTRLDAQALMHDSTRAAAAGDDGAARLPAVIEYLQIAGRTWTLQVPSAGAGQEAPGPNRQPLILGAGVSLSLLLTLLTWNLATSRSRARALAREMTRELRESEHRFRQLAQHDVLTGLPNRSLFGDRLQQALAQARRDRAKLAVIYLDLDKFKPVNDTLGHGVGDLLLKEVAKRMLGCVRQSDTVGRIGGDEFVVLLPHVDGHADALLVADKIRHALNQPFHLEGGHTANIASSSGVALYPDHGTDALGLSVAADQAMYLAKECGRNQVRLADAPAPQAKGG